LKEEVDARKTTSANQLANFNFRQSAEPLFLAEGRMRIIRDANKTVPFAKTIQALLQGGALQLFVLLPGGLHQI
jgi:hypothetical protein